MKVYGTAMKLNIKNKKQFVAIGHNLSPVVIVGSKGLTDTLHEEIDRALDDHELIKIKLVAENDKRKLLSKTICKHHNAELVQQIGKMILILRHAARPKIKTSNLILPAKTSLNNH